MVAWNVSAGAWLAGSPLLGRERRGVGVGAVWFLLPCSLSGTGRRAVFRSDNKHLFLQPVRIRASASLVGLPVSSQYTRRTPPVNDGSAGHQAAGGLSKSGNYLAEHFFLGLFQKPLRAWTPSAADHVLGSNIQASCERVGVRGDGR